MKHDQNTAERLAGLIGLARRAGKLTTGFDAVAALIAADKHVIVLLASDLSNKTEKELNYIAVEKAVHIYRIPFDKEKIGQTIGLHKPVGVLALEDKGFAASVEKLCRHDYEEECIL